MAPLIYASHLSLRIWTDLALLSAGPPSPVESLPHHATLAQLQLLGSAQSQWGWCWIFCWGLRLSEYCDISSLCLGRYSESCWTFEIEMWLRLRKRKPTIEMALGLSYINDIGGRSPPFWGWESTGVMSPVSLLKLGERDGKNNTEIAIVDLRGRNTPQILGGI